MGLAQMYTADTKKIAWKGVTAVFKDILKRGLWGFVTGMAIGNILMIILGYLDSGTTMFFPPDLAVKTGSALNAIALQTLLSGVLGMVGMSSSVIYSVEKCPLAAATAVHFVIWYVLYIIIGFTLCWLTCAEDVLIMFAAYIVAYTFIWLGMSLKYKAEVNRLNKLQKQYNAAVKA